jgi:hypothetical protein
MLFSTSLHAVFRLENVGGVLALLSFLSASICLLKRNTDYATRSTSSEHCHDGVHAIVYTGVYACVARSQNMYMLKAAIVL